MRGKYISLLIVPYDKAGIHEISISSSWGLVLMTILVLGLSFLVFCTIGYCRKSVQVFEVEKLRGENARLVERAQETEVSLVQLRTEMGRLANESDELRAVMDLPEIDPDVRMMGIGGLLLGSGNTILSSPAEAYVEELESDIDQLLRQARLEKASFEEIKSKFLTQTERFAHTPSIIPTVGYLSSGFGWRRDPFTGRRTFHWGVDISGRPGTPVYATADGTVKKIQYLPRSFGRLIIIKHGYGYETVYAHLSRIDVEKGQEVKRGQEIGAMGKTGRATGTHLHYEVRVGGKVVTPLDYFYAQDYTGT